MSRWGWPVEIAGVHFQTPELLALALPWLLLVVWIGHRHHRAIRASAAGSPATAIPASASICSASRCSA